MNTSNLVRGKAFVPLSL